MMSSVLVLALGLFAAPGQPSFQMADAGEWRPINLMGERALPGLTVTTDEGVLRLRGRTAQEGGNLGGVRTVNAYRASPGRPFSVRATRLYHGGRTARGEHGLVLWRAGGQFVYVREPLESLFKDWNHYQSWQVLSGSATGIETTDISDENAFLGAHPQPLFDCALNRAPRRVEIRHDGSTVRIFLDGGERHSLQVPWSDGFCVAVIAGGLMGGIPVDVAFSDLEIDGESQGELAALPIDALSWEPAPPSYWRGDPRLEDGAAEQVRAGAGAPQLAMVVRSLWPPALKKQFIDWSVEHGLNCIALDIPWGQVERERGRFDFSHFDGIINYAVNRGLWVQIKPWWIRRTYPDWISPALEQEPIGGDRLLQELTFAVPELNDHIARFVRATVEHYRGYPVTCYTPVGATAAELEYSHADFRDASQWARRQFREWLAGRYGDVQALNTAWGAQLTSFEEAGPPVELRPAVDEPDLRQSVLDWFCYREWAIRQLVDRLGEAVHDADPQALLAVQVGRVQDGPVCPRRATVGAFYWARAADMLIADPQPRDGDMMGYIIDLIRTGGKIPGMELDAPARFELPLAEYTRNSVECWQHGGLWSSWANWAPPELEQPDILTMTDATVNAMRTPYQVAQPETALYVSKWDLYCYQGGGRWREYRDAYARLAGDAREVIDVITDDMILADASMLGRYRRIVAPFADCIDRRVVDLLSQTGARLERGDSFARHRLDVSTEPVVTPTVH